MLTRWKWLAPVLVGVLLALLAVQVGQAQAATNAQMTVASTRVAKEARKLRRQHRYTTVRDGQTVVVTPRARWTVFGNTDGDSVTTLRWRIRVQNPPQPGTAHWLVCRGRVTVRGEAVNDPSKLTATLTTRICTA
jgi:hypothetical protein